MDQFAYGLQILPEQRLSTVYHEVSRTESQDSLDQILVIRIPSRTQSDITSHETTRLWPIRKADQLKPEISGTVDTRDEYWRNAIMYRLTPDNFSYLPISSMSALSPTFSAFRQYT